MSLPFIKMNGAGNDFVIFDGRESPVKLTAEQVRKIADRNNAVTKGCDQVIIMEAPPSLTLDAHSHRAHAGGGDNKADVFMRIYNADGGEVDACGNATRCVASLLEAELKRLPVSIETKAGIWQGLQKAYTTPEDEYILVDLGAPKFDWQQIPLTLPLADAAKKVEALCNDAAFKHPAFVSMGNPHVVFFLRFNAAKASENFDPEDVAKVDLERIGPALEKYSEVFPQGVNVSVAMLRAAKDGQGHIIHARVWERGAGFTKACGTAACAMLALAHARDSAVRGAHLWFEPEGYSVTVKMDENGHILLGGPVETEFSARVNV